MQKIVLLILFFFISHFVKAQSEPSLPLFQQDYMFYNPAYTAFNENGSFQISNIYHGFPPSNDPFPFNHLSNDFIASSEFPFNNQFIKGLGFYYLRQQLGFVYGNSLAIAYANSIKLYDKIDFRFGFDFSMNNQIWDYDGDHLSDPPYFNTSKTLYDMALGFIVSYDKLIIGASVKHLFEPDYIWEEIHSHRIYEDEKFRYFYLMSNYTFSLSDKWKMKPDLIFNISPYHNRISINNSFIYNDKFIAGVGYSNYLYGCFFVGIKLFEKLELSLANKYLFAKSNFPKNIVEAAIRFSF